MIEQIFIFWLLSPDDIPTRFYQTFDDTWNEERRKNYIRDISSYPNFVGYHLYNVSLVSFEIK